MDLTHWVVLGGFAAACLLVLLGFWVWSLLRARATPESVDDSLHEFAYGAVLKNIDELPRAVEQFLSAPELDRSKIRVSADIWTYCAEDAQPMIEYLRDEATRDPEAQQLLDFLADAEKTAIHTPPDRDYGFDGLPPLIRYLQDVAPGRTRGSAAHWRTDRGRAGTRSTNSRRSGWSRSSGSTGR